MAIATAGRIESWTRSEVGLANMTFFAKLVRFRYASMFDCRHNRARIYHVNQRALDAAIGEADSRLRKP